MEEINIIVSVEYKTYSMLIKINALLDRWKKEHANLKEEQEKIVGNCLITASFLAYTGCFNWEMRLEMLNVTWKKNIKTLKIPFSTRYRLESELIDEMAISRFVCLSYSL